MNDWSQVVGLWSLKTPTGLTLIQVKFDHDIQEYRVAQNGGQRLGRNWDEAKRQAEQLAIKPSAPAPESRKSRKGR